MDTEEYFPRGKIANATEIKPFSVHTNFLFDTNKRKNSTSEYDNVKRTRLNEKSSNEFVLEINYSTIEVGMTLLACVRSITTLSIEVELPGKMSGKIKITSISDPLTKLLRQKALGTLTDDCAQLDKMFSIGQFIPTKVLSKETTGKGTELALSMSPTDLHRTWSYDKFRKGCVIWTAIESRQDHGYQLDVGNGDCRIFLPDKNVGSGMTYGIGQPLWCVVKKSTILGDTITLVVSPLDGQTKLTDDAEAFNLIPGTPVSFTVSKVSMIYLARKILKPYISVPTKKGRKIPPNA
uniref:S1 motif domain-containing protein n=1 Tax=Photinus pyralis TaxID=7054 RepID=A0A1Y1N2B3_PHOPY